jgi:hypothetical protein
LQKQQSLFKATKSCQIKKFSRCTTFIWVACSFDKVVVILFTEHISLI